MRIDIIMVDSNTFKFSTAQSIISLLGQNLFSNFETVLSEIISNSWDADANNVWIDFDSDKSNFQVRDDGTGMNIDTLNDCFLKLGYSKRTYFSKSEKYGRPLIGSKGIGKLSVFSLAEQVSILTSSEVSEAIGIKLDCKKLQKINNNRAKLDEIVFENVDLDQSQMQIDDLKHGTIIHFHGVNPVIRSKLETVKKRIARSCRFSVNDSNFKIHVNDELVTTREFDDLIRNTENCWVINGFSDEFTSSFSRKTKFQLKSNLNYRGFLATVRVPSDLVLSTSDGTQRDHATVDLYSNGLLREKDILRLIPTRNIAESYLYGHIHFDEIADSDIDPFSVSRETIMRNHPNFVFLLNDLRQNILSQIVDQWKVLRKQRDSKQNIKENYKIPNNKKPEKSNKLFSR